MYRRFTSFDQADAEARHMRMNEPTREIQILHSPQDDDIAPGVGGPWILESPAGMVRTWETLAAYFPSNGKATYYTARVHAINNQ